jgi:hypothetical protein
MKATFTSMEDGYFENFSDNFEGCDPLANLGIYMIIAVQLPSTAMCLYAWIDMTWCNTW